MGSKSRDKGKRGELELAKELAVLLGEARRTQQFNGKGDSDVLTPDYPELHWESKRAEAFNIYRAMDQAQGDKKEGQVPIVCHRRNGKEWLAIVRLADLKRLVAILQSPTKPSSETTTSPGAGAVDETPGTSPPTGTPPGI